MALRSRGSSFRPRFSSGQRRKTTWSDGPEGIVALSASGSILIPVGITANISATTLVRVRGSMIIGLTATSAALDGFHGAFGLCLVSDNAATVGITAIPQPVTDSSWDGWLYHHTFAVKTLTGTITNANNALAAFERTAIDSKAMRKWKESDVLVGVLEATEVGTSVLTAELRSRFLVKLP